jgi:uncharacterized membrane protein
MDAGNPGLALFELLRFCGISLAFLIFALAGLVVYLRKTNRIPDEKELP